MNQSNRMYVKEITVLEAASRGENSAKTAEKKAAKMREKVFTNIEFWCVMQRHPLDNDYSVSGDPPRYPPPDPEDQSR